MRLKFWGCFWMLLLTACAHADLVGRDEGAGGLLLSEDGTVAATQNWQSDSNFVRIWSVKTQSEIAAFPVEKGTALYAISPDGKRVFTSRGQWKETIDGWKMAWSLRDSGKQRILDAKFIRDEVWVVRLGRIDRFTSNGQRITPIEYDEGSGHLSRKKVNARPYSYTGELSQDGSRVLLWENGWARVCDTAAGRRISSFKEPEKYRYNNRGYHLSPDGSFVFLSSSYVDTDIIYDPQDGPPLITSLTTFDASTGSLLQYFEGGFQNFNYPILPGRASTFVFDRGESYPILYDARDGQQTQLKLSHPLPAGAVRTIRFSRDGKTLVALYYNGNIWAEKVI